jgi:hypothetical protein
MKKYTRKLKIGYEQYDSYWYWNINANIFFMEDLRGHDSKQKAVYAAHLFINKCFTDRSTWPDEFK